MSERFYEPEEHKHRDPELPSDDRLADLRRRSQAYSQSARDAIARVKAHGSAMHQLDALKNEGGQ